jgi:hypothetical protein
MGKVSKAARGELIEALRARYRSAPKVAKGRILTEFVAVSGYHRKHAIRLLSRDMEGSEQASRLGTRVYDEAVKSAVIVIWETADRICGKRLKAAIPVLLAAMERHGHLQLDATVRERVLSVSPATIDRLLAPVRKSAGSRRRRRRVRRLDREIPIKTFQDWTDTTPGHLEIDLVVHGGGSMGGECLHSLVVTDVCSGWTEAVALLAREQSLVVEGLDQIRKQVPVPVLGIDSDNDSAFLNDTLADYCKREKITFTRSRAYRKNDQAWIEQKNGAVIRRIVGHARLCGLVPGQALAQLYRVARLHVNYFQPSLKLSGRIREGGKVRKSYHPAATPCERLLAHPLVTSDTKDALRTQQAELDPVKLLHRIRQGQAALAALSNGDPGADFKEKNLEEFLSQLPTLWRLGEARPTHRTSPVTRSWRTRPDPFAGEWTEILLWLQAEPDLTAKSMMQRLSEKHPGRHKRGELRTLQRRVAEWRRSMARSLILSGTAEIRNIGPISPPPCSAAGDAPLRLAPLASVPPPPQQSTHPPSLTADLNHRQTCLEPPAPDGNISR